MGTEELRMPQAVEVSEMLQGFGELPGSPKLSEKTKTKRDVFGSGGFGGWFRYLAEYEKRGSGRLLFCYDLEKKSLSI